MSKVKEVLPSEKKPSKSSPKDYVYEAEHPDKDGNLVSIRLTKEDLDYRNDKYVSAIMDVSDIPPEYEHMATLRAIRNYINNAIPTMKEEFARYKKRGRI